MYNETFDATVVVGCGGQINHQVTACPSIGIHFKSLLRCLLVAHPPYLVEVLPEMTICERELMKWETISQHKYLLPTNHMGSIYKIRLIPFYA